MAECIVLQALYDDSEPECYAYFDILREFVQPGAPVTVDATIAQLLESMPAYGNDGVAVFLDACYDIAEQIPYRHASHDKLVTLVDCILNTDKINPPTEDPVSQSWYIFTCTSWSIG